MCDLIREMPEKKNHTERLKRVNLLMNGAWRSLGKIAGHSKIRKHGPKGEKLIQYSSLYILSP